jgi:hypothetical protein
VFHPKPRKARVPLLAAIALFIGIAAARYYWMGPDHGFFDSAIGAVNAGAINPRR